MTGLFSTGTVDRADRRVGEKRLESIGFFKGSCFQKSPKRRSSNGNALSARFSILRGLEHLFHADDGSTTLGTAPGSRTSRRVRHSSTFARVPHPEKRMQASMVHALGHVAPAASPRAGAKAVTGKARALATPTLSVRARASANARRVSVQAAGESHRQAVG